MMNFINTHQDIPGEQAMNKFRFKCAMENIDSMISSPDEGLMTKDEKYELIASIRNLVIKDICYSFRASFLYADNMKKQRAYFYYPNSYYINGVKKEIPAYEEMVTLKSDNTIVTPWNGMRLLKALLRMYDFQYDPNNHRCLIYKSLGINVVTNGKHSICKALENKEEVRVKGTVIDDEEFIKTIYKTDGVYIYMENGNKYDFPLPDYRFAVLIELTKRLLMQKINLKNKNI